ncbi:MAG: 3-oxoacyl-ACP reductase FabG [Clostridiaceae bacterium]|nr:3-oxoacyl-ACP reductase FabG [Clostridiales bacterium]MDD6877192.1 3-oxoacyl-ACP reductase FabG [Clostridiaceae bacterium]MDY3071692.1 3-oxoacyl-ACP reductase FabG [Eubacteriales bacterium]MDY3286170.1 3-oxoacyl-ACP reductase FabG [Eubacteriales bacterium]MDY5016705.1 3-oxoacyl-ACP reductase FabG [Eubacteriales bacterium]
MLTDKIAVVTGGTRGIGRAICETFHKNGARVAFLYAGNTELAAEQEARLPGSRGYRCDVADAAAVKAVFAEIARDFGPVGILVNNAGLTRDHLALGMREEDFTRVLDVNLTGAFHTIREAYPVFLKRRSGRIINISSVSGLVGNPGQVNYSASKAGLIGLTKSVARELASRGVTCNAIAPGFVETDMTKDLGDSAPLLSSIPMKRFAKPEEIAAAALFLASDAAGYITGEVLRVDGGLAM